jgi:hypothetical protein
MSRKLFLLPAIGLIIGLIVSPVAAYNVEELYVEILSDGSATVIAGYNLNWGEYIVYNLMLDREKMAEEAIKNALHKDVQVDYITSDEASVKITSFAKIVENDSNVSYITPKLPYNRIEDYSGKFDLPLLSNFVVDTDLLTPDKTIITFPDGYSVNYSKPYAGGFVPSISH